MPAEHRPCAADSRPGPLAGKHLNVFKAMAHGPAMIDAYLAMSGALGKASLSAKEREIIALVASQETEEEEPWREEAWI